MAVQKKKIQELLEESFIKDNYDNSEKGFKSTRTQFHKMNRKELKEEEFNSKYILVLDNDANEVSFIEIGSLKVTLPFLKIEENSDLHNLILSVATEEEKKKLKKVYDVFAFQEFIFGVNRVSTVQYINGSLTGNEPIQAIKILSQKMADENIKSMEFMGLRIIQYPLTQQHLKTYVEEKL